MALHSNLKIVFALRILIGILFVFSAISKLLPIESFEFILVSQGITNWHLAPYLSRLVISIELFIGVSFLIGRNLKKIFIPAAFILLIIFSFHLVYTIYLTHNTGNCGCFGEVIQMSSLAALIKNVILLWILFYMYRSVGEEGKGNLLLPASLFIIIIAGIFLIFQVKSYNVPVNNKEYSNKISQFAKFKNFSNEKNVDLNEGEKIVALLSLDCEHCMAAAHKISELSDEMKLPPVYYLFLGDEDQLDHFFEKGGKRFPYKIIPPQTFFPLIKDVPPRVCLLMDGNIIGDWDMKTFNEANLKAAVAHLP
jgi:Methylamine utilisation protein MauE